jgi:hypothetical protein
MDTTIYARERGLKILFMIFLDSHVEIREVT